MKTHHLLFTAICLLLPAVTQATPTLLTSFETSEGFAVGTNTNSAGWTIPTNGIITDSKAFTGTNSMKLSKGTGLATYALTVSQLGSNYNSIAWEVLTEGFVSNAQIGLWQVRYGGNQVESRVEFKLTYGATASDALKLEYASTYTGYTTTYTTTYLTNITGNSITNWQHVAVSFDFTNATPKYRILYGGETVADYESLVTGISTPRISHVYLRNGVAGTGDPISYFDTMTLDHVVIPEPSTVWLLGVSVALMVLFLRKKRRIQG